MSMDHAQFEALVHRMEALAAARPGWYRLRMLGLALLGYGYLLAVIVGLLLLIVLMAVFVRSVPALGAKMILLLLPLLFVIVRSLWVRLHPPEGPRITRREAPALFDLLDRLRARQKTPRIHVVLLTPELNAAITQLPRLGLFGWHRNYLLLGMSLMKSLTVEQLEAVLAHELGHLSRGHARIANWIYRMRRMWQQLELSLEQNTPVGAGVVRSFFKWYVPHFAACSYPLARHNEFEADAASIAATSPRIAAQALTNTSVMAQYLYERYWPAIHAQAREVVHPSFAPYRDLNAQARAGLKSEDAQRWLADALARTTTYDDTHPCLTERLAAIKAAAEIALPEPDAAADTLFGTQREALEKRFDEEWSERVRPSWQQVYEQTQVNRERLKVLREKAATAPLDIDKSLELATLEEREGAGPDAALALRRALVAREPGSVHARFLLARQLLERDDPEGLSLLKDVLGKDQEVSVAAAQLLRDYWWNKGDRALAEQWHEYLLTSANGLQKDQRARMNRQIKGQWTEHGLSDEALQNLVTRLKGLRGLRRAWLARAAREHPTDPTTYILGYGVQVFGYLNASRAQQIMDDLTQPGWLDEPTVVLHVEANNRHLQRKFKKIRGSRIL